MTELTSIDLDDREMTILRYVALHGPCRYRDVTALFSRSRVSGGIVDRVEHLRRVGLLTPNHGRQQRSIAITEAGREALSDRTNLPARSTWPWHGDPELIADAYRDAKGRLCFEYC